ncbi:DUF6498-containing protein [Halorubrum ezzemoulense]|uniref:DUF6498-containing protein n=1 Tax=Halorubrum ezzemoulense TaxID=337243 RepID=UPI00232D171D|nr:DUF6498-containing protein [Halorubrum ezzemoulense]MDB9250803.1 DUF6498-containing protein [Halorubrum ezzemoulense]MDB9260919.1 DUF6498-containing protein [Halorubrum ezzemoulense]MDB9264365.1 DUF6498-containing protein [Halorubrum ezzemoulense]MDB9267819.1 DUF6498-containing protein [Halorubrum ezzemoulense]MDB9271280.1 DUF6498-containing protein [Halorubrum ezzemoulense]
MSSAATTHNTEDSRLPDPELSALLVANLVPVVGIVVFNLSVLELLTLYWLEFGVVCFWAVVRATFAGRPMERNGDPILLGAIATKKTSISVPLIGANVRLLTIPTLLFVVPILIGLWLFVGALVVGPVANVNPDANISSWLIAGAFGIFIAAGWRTATTYFRDGDYQDHNVATALQSVVTEGATVLLASIIALLTAALVVSNGGGGETSRAVERVATGPLVAVVVSIRLLTDLAEYYYDGRLGAGLWSLVGRGDAYSPPERETIETTLSGNPTVLRPSLSGRLLPTASHFRTHPGLWLLTPLAFLAASLAVFDGATQIAGGIMLLGTGVPLGLIHLDYWIRYAGVEYRLDSDTIVATDTLFQTPLWRYESLADHEVRIERDAVDRWLDTSTVLVDRGDRPTKLPRLEDTTPITDSLVDVSTADNDAGANWNANTNGPDTMVEVSIELLRLDSTAPRMSLVSMTLFGVVSLIALVIAAHFEGGAAAGVFVFLFTVIPLVGLIIYQISNN